MTGAEFDDMEPCELFDDEPDDFGGWREDDDCDHADDPERCSECLMWGEYQCSQHAEAYLNFCREVSERHDVVEALRTVLALPEAWAGPAWYALRDRAREVLAEMRETTEGAS